jgi:succinyl-CoA synthetase alpha subunit
MNTYKMASDNISLVDNIKALQQADVANLTLLDPDTPTYQKAAQHS